MASTAGLRCASCATDVFATSTEHRAHYGTDWHRYNLKRKVAGLGPIGKADFEMRRAAALARSGATDAAGAVGGGGSGRHGGKGDSHLKRGKDGTKKMSKAQARAQAKARERAAAAAAAAAAATSSNPAEEGGSSSVPAGTPDVKVSNATAAAEAAADGRAMFAAAVSSNEGEVPASSAETAEDVEAAVEAAREAVTINDTDCLFCNKPSADVDANLRHMDIEHGFFVPDVEYLTDKSGLVKYLADKIKVGRICLYCNGRGKTFHSWWAVQAHMRSKSHCKLLYADDEDVPEYEDFYDFSKSYVEAGAGSSAGAAGAGAGSGEPKSGETDAESDIAVPRVTVDDVTGELVFDDGRVAGHRAYRQLYKQHVRMPDMRESVVASRAAFADRGYVGSDSAIVDREGGSMHALMAVKGPGRSGPKGLAHLAKPERMFKVEQSRNTETRKRMDVKVGVKSNKIILKHFRLQVLF